MRERLRTFMHACLLFVQGMENGSSGLMSDQHDRLAARVEQLEERVNVVENLSSRTEAR